MPKNRFFLFFLILLVLCSFCFASQVSSYIDNRDLISSAIKISYPSGEATTLDFVLRADEIIDVEDLATKVDLYANSIFFVKEWYQDDNRLDIGRGNYVRNTGSTQLRMNAKVICKQTGELVDERLKSFDQNNYGVGVSGADYCGNAQPCCAIVLHVVKEGNFIGGESSNIASIVSIIICIIIILSVFALIFVYRKKPKSLIGLIYIFSVPTLLMALPVFLGLFYYIIELLRGYNDFLGSRSFVFYLLFLFSFSIFVSSFFVSKSKNMPVEKKLFWLKIFAVMAFFLNLFMLFFLSFSVLSD